jgi:cellulose synthase/poly-beta-1,6-N-acetylglucosamine synthase-like glycosyltransferase
LSAVLHLPFFGILLFLLIGIGERLGFYWKGRAPETPGRMPSVHPTVCVQLPMYNEHLVARRVIEAAARMHWPVDRLSIQVLDDSTNEDTRRLVEQVSAEVRAQGRDCRVLHRADRHGYKAGALEAGRLQTKAEFLVIFDADFIPPEDFLLRAIPHFYQPDGQPDTSLAMVQTQWGHLNHNESALTLSQSLWVDDHHTLQMAWRSAAWEFINFTGTAGVWRASAVEAAGGWRAASLVEDAELSFRVLFDGYRMKFVKEIVAPAELPATYTAYKAQQRRWTMGWVQVQRLHLRTLLGYPASWLRRLQLLYLMCISWQWPLWAIWMLVLPFMIITDLWLGALSPAWGIAAYLLPSLVWLTLSAAMSALETKHTYAEPLTPRRFLGRFRRAFPQAVISTGMLAHQSSAFAEGMFGPLHSEFERTPKTATVSRRARSLTLPASAHASATENIDRAKVHWPYVLSELFFITYQLVWALIFAVSGMIWGALVAACVAGCTIYLAFFYQGVWRYACDRSHLYARVLGATALLLVCLSIAGQFSTLTLEYALLTELAPIFDVDLEQNLPTFFSVTLLLIATLLLAVIATRANKQRIYHASTWRFLAFGFLVMALDEALALHERLNVPIGRLFGEGSLGVLYFPWVIPAVVLVFALGLFFLRFLLDIPVTTRLRFLIAATLYVGGAIGVELLGSRHAELHGYENWTYSMIVTLEESLEMAGLIVFIWALLSYGADSHREAQFSRWASVKFGGWSLRSATRGTRRSSVKAASRAAGDSASAAVVAGIPVDSSWREARRRRCPLPAASIIVVNSSGGPDGDGRNAYGESSNSGTGGPMDDSRVRGSSRRSPAGRAGAAAD